MNTLESLIERRFDSLATPIAVQLPSGRQLGPSGARVRLRLHALRPLADLAFGRIGALAGHYVEGRLDIDGPMHELMEAAGSLVGGNPAQPVAGRLWWQALWARAGSLLRHHSAEVDTRQVRFHYDVSDEFFALWLDPRRVYSCAYYRDTGMALAQAQEAKLDHICRKLMLRQGERFLDIGAGWGGLLLWAAQQYGVSATGITLSRNQHAHVQRLIDEQGLKGQVRMLLLDYRALPEDEPWDKIASVGMFEHVGRAMLPAYFAKARRLLRPGGLLMNHGITAGGTANRQLGAGIGGFVERYIFPGGELQHLSRVLRDMAGAGLETLDVENLRPHYARTLWAWSNALEAHLASARRIAGEKVVRAYRLYLAGSAMGFERGWISLHQMLAARPSGAVGDGPMRGAQSSFPFQRAYMYRA